MSRGIGEFGPIQEVIPEWMAVVVALLTQLGDVWFLGLVLTSLYWFDVRSRDGTAAVAGLWLAGMGLYNGIKVALGFPRPNRPLLDPELLPRLVRPLYEATALASGYGFPSGHAVNATVVYVGLAAVLAVSTRRRRSLAAATIVTTVCFTRVALGVHYLVDVVAGVALGAALLGGAFVLARRGPADRATVSFGLAIVFCTFFLAISDADPDAVFVLAASLGAFAGWQFIVLGRQLAIVSRPSRAVRPIVLRGGAAVLALAPILGAFEFVSIPSTYPTGGAVGVVTATIVTLPVARRSETVNRVAVASWFWLGMAALGVAYLLAPQTWLRATAAAFGYGKHIRERLRTRRDR